MACLLASAKGAAVQNVAVIVGDVDVPVMVLIQVLPLLVVGGDPRAGLREFPKPQAPYLPPSLHDPKAV